ncbi:MAG: Stf0 family sulfotransferase [Sphingomicrobium sp.]
MTALAAELPRFETPPRTREDLLEFCTHYFGAERVGRIQNELAMPHHGGFRAPKNILIMLFPSRAGSNYFGQLLCSTGWFNEIAESFNPGQVAKVKAKHGLADSHEALQWMIDNRGTPHAFGFKAGFFVLTAAAESGFLSEVIDRAHVILLRRRDHVAQAVSLQKGKLGGRMHTLQDGKRELTDEDYDPRALLSEVHNIERTERRLAEAAERLGKTAPVFYYEDICADPVANVTAVMDLMGLEMPWNYEPRKVRLDVLRDDLSKRWCERFRDENPEYR